jgi:hypothetical protein
LSQPASIRMIPWSFPPAYTVHGCIQIASPYSADWDCPWLFTPPGLIYTTGVRPIKSGSVGSPYRLYLNNPDIKGDLGVVLPGQTIQMGTPMLAATQDAQNHDDTDNKVVLRVARADDVGIALCDFGYMCWCAPIYKDCSPCSNHMWDGGVCDYGACSLHPSWCHMTPLR